MRKTTLAIVFLGILAAPAVAAGAQPSDADLLRSAEPAPDAVIVAAPSHLRLEFGETLVPGSPAIRLFTSGVESSGVGEVTTSGGLLEATLDPLAQGRYLVSWAVEGETAGELGGGYFFTIDPTGRGAIEVDRRVADARGAGGLRVTASVVAFVGGFLLTATLVATTIDPGATASRSAAAAAAVTAGSAAVALATPSGRGWIAVIAATAAVPLLLVLRRDDPRAPLRLGWRIGAGAIGVVVAVGVAAGMGTVASSGPAVVALAFIVAAGGAVAWLLDQRVIAVFGAVGAATVVFVGVFLSGPTGHTASLDGEALALEVDIEPAQQGVNEVHVYAFSPAGDLAALAGTEAWVTHLPTDAGPIRVPLLRAGPNHFLTYTADLPLVGDWKVEFIAAGEGGETAHLDTIVNVR